MTSQALNRSLRCEETHPALAITACEHFAISSQGIVTPLGRFVLLDLRTKLGLFSTGRGLDQIERDFRPWRVRRSSGRASRSRAGGPVRPGSAATIAMAPCCSTDEPCSSRSRSGAIAAAGSTLASSRSASVRLLAPGKIKAREAASGAAGVVQLIESLDRQGAQRVGLLGVARQGHEWTAGLFDLQVSRSLYGRSTHPSRGRAQDCGKLPAQ